MQEVVDHLNQGSLQLALEQEEVIIKIHQSTLPHKDRHIIKAVLEAALIKTQATITGSCMDICNLTESLSFRTLIYIHQIFM
jgi:hypothetical protein